MVCLTLPCRSGTFAKEAVLTRAPLSTFLAVAIFMTMLAGITWHPASLLSQEREGPPRSEQNKKDGSTKPVPEPKKFVTSQSGTFNGQSVKYTATAGEIYLHNDKEEPTASIFYISYVKEAVSDPRTRPVTFIFNGGPGSASLWLHMGVFGPKRIVVPSDAKPVGAPPYDVEANPVSILDVSDLVFIDPVGTGYSRVIGKGKTKDFWGIHEDAESLAEFMRIYITRNQRWNSPKYIIGESYGTLRAVALVKKLQQGYNAIALNGLVLISSILNFPSTTFTPENDKAYISFLPTYAATAWYHDKLAEKPDSLETLLDEVRRFALEDYASALLKGSRLKPAERAHIVEQLHRFTGLSKRYIEQANLRISAPRFAKELLRDEGKVVGRFDTRYLGEEYDDVGEEAETDPSSYGINAAFVAAINDYLHRDLKVDFTRDYKILPGDVARGWNWSILKRGRWPVPVNVAPWLGEGMRENQDLRVLVANGYYDLATPFFATENTFANNGINPERVTFDYFPAGHMMYTHQESLEKLVSDVRAFMTP